MNQIKYTRDGDILFSVAKDKVICAWFTANGERLGTYHGHLGAIWTVDISPNTKLLASGGADNTIRLWNPKTGENVKTWEFPTAIKRVAFSEDGKQLLGVTEKRMGYLGTIVVFDIRYGDDLSEQSNEHSLRITCEESKATVAGWSYLDKYIIAGHEDGSVSQYDAKVSLPIAPRRHILILLTRRRVNNSSEKRSMNTRWRFVTYNSPLIEHISLLLERTRQQRFAHARSVRIASRC